MLGVVVYQAHADTTPIPIARGSQVITFSGQGFDKCEIPLLEEMATWATSSPYGVVNLYIGGVNRACTNLPLTAVFLSQLSQQGWKFIPTWVGPQAPCSNIAIKMNSDPTIAYQEGMAEADAAIAAAADLGLTLFGDVGTVIYYDVEAYDVLNGVCRTAVSAFITGWTEQMHNRGNLAGVYGSACGSALSDFAALEHTPDAIWAAHWIRTGYDPTVTVWDVACLDNSLWNSHQRIRQYTGDHQETWGEVPLIIDSNVLDGPVVDLSPNPLPLPLTADFTGDGLDDAATFVPVNGAWLVSPSCGGRFEPATNWLKGFGVGAAQQFTGDFNGDGMQDSAVFSGGEWQVALSTGGSFAAPTVWGVAGIGDEMPLVGDFNGDGSTDSLVFTPVSSQWQVAFSTGSSFFTPTTWLTWTVSSDAYFAADFDGDNQDDVAAFTALSGTWSVALSTGSSFLTPTIWATGHGISSDEQLVGDFDGNGMVDSAVFFEYNGSWHVALSTGTTFAPFSQWAGNLGSGAQQQTVGDFDGDQLTDAAAFYAEGNTWHIALSNGSTFDAPYPWNSIFACNAVIRQTYLPLLIKPFE